MFKPSMHKLNEIQKHQQNNCVQAAAAAPPVPPTRRLSLTIDINEHSNDDYSKTRISGPSSSSSSSTTTHTSSSNNTNNGNSTNNEQKILNVTLNKGPSGFGIAISENRHNKLIIRGINVNGVAFQVSHLKR